MHDNANAQCHPTHARNVQHTENDTGLLNKQGQTGKDVELIPALHLAGLQEICWKKGNEEENCELWLPRSEN